MLSKRSWTQKMEAELTYATETEINASFTLAVLSSPNDLQNLKNELKQADKLKTSIDIQRDKSAKAKKEIEDKERKISQQKEKQDATDIAIIKKNIGNAFENWNKKGEFEKEAIAKLDALFLKNNIQIMVGGSGLYVDAVLKGFDDFPEINSEFREEVRKKYEENGIEYLQEILKDKDVEYFVFKGKIKNEAYSKSSEPIRILKKDKTIETVVEASDQMHLKALSKTVTKYFICYPKVID